MHPRLALLYRRYATQHLHLVLGEISIASDRSIPVVLRQGRVCVNADDVLLEQDGARSEGAAPSLPYAPGAPIRVALRNAGRDPVTLPAPSSPSWLAAHLTLWPGLLRRIVQTLPLLPHIRDPHMRSRAKAHLGLTQSTPAPLLHLAPSGTALRALSTPIAILLSVYNAKPHVLCCLDRITTMTDLPWRLVIVEDGSTDPTLRPLLQTWVTAHPDATLLCHDTPRGFAAAVNAGLAALGPIDRPVVLLNSDVTLPQGWASRLIAPLLTDGTIASVTPLSNEGELMGAPHANDPLTVDRLRAGLLGARARLGQTSLPVYLAHSLGGGTARWLDQRLATHEVAVVLRVGGPLRWQIELHTQAGVTRGATAHFAVIQTLLNHAGPREVVYVCAVGDPAPEEVPFRLLDLCAGGHRLEMMVHDYYPLNRDYTFRSEADPEWQALWRPALDRADHLTVFSEASSRIVAGVHPEMAHKIRLRPHGLLGPVPRLSPAPLGQMVIGVPGNLNDQKGALVVRDLAPALARTREARLVVLGVVAPDCPVPRSVTVQGGYRLEDLPHLVARHGIGARLIPPLWPETFSYVTQESLATGLPCIGFDLAGQGDALRRAENGHVVSLRNGAAPDVDAVLRTLRAVLGWPEAALEIDSKPLRHWPLRRVQA